jgi:CDP-diglyceride synthetase
MAELMDGLYSPGLSLAAMACGICWCADIFTKALVGELFGRHRRTVLSLL